MSENPAIQFLISQSLPNLNFGTRSVQEKLSTQLTNNV